MTSKLLKKLDTKSEINSQYFHLHNRRYIGSKYKLTEWIFSILLKECKGSSFADIFAGTGVVAAKATENFNKVIVNDFLFSNHLIYKAFFSAGLKNQKKIKELVHQYNNLDADKLNENYFSKNYGGKYYSNKTSKIIGFIRDDIEQNIENLTEKEYCILIASLIYSIDKIANTVGHYEAFFKKNDLNEKFNMKLIKPINTKNVSIFRKDANVLVKEIETDIVYIDPPYNSRQYSRFYHLLENLTKWEKPKLYGVALKPEPENTSDYCKVGAKDKLQELVNNINAKYIVLSYNNTYNSKSSSSRNKISLAQVEAILKDRGDTKIFEKKYRHFNAGKTDFSNHKEFIFITSLSHE